jgi:transposase
MRFVTVKTVAQQDMLAVHRIRSELVRQRTAKAKQIRGLLAEYGVIVPVGINALRRALPEIQEDVENGLSGLFRRLLDGLHADLVELDRRVEQLDGEIQAAANKTDPRSRWIVGVVARRHKNVAAVALANKNARIAWALIVRGGTYNNQFGMAAA